MKRYEEFEETVKRKRLVEHTCDRCGARLNSGTCYEVAKVEVSCETGHAFPEGTDTETDYFDCCLDCFYEFVSPALEKMGFIKHTKETSF